MATQTKLNYLTNSNLFSNYYLKNLLPESDTWEDVDEKNLREVYQDIKELYKKKKGNFENYNEYQLENNFIRPIFEMLDLSYEVQEKVDKSRKFPDYGIFKNQEAADEAIQNKGDKDFYRNAITIADAKRWQLNLDKRGDTRHPNNPSFQIWEYLQETPVDWGILTNGKEWRLYHTETSDKIDYYLQMDLPAILENDDLEAFKYFYLFFRKGAFVEDENERSFLDKVYDKSNLFSEELGEDLKGNIYEAIRLLSEGFLEFPENNLDSEEDIDLIHDSSLIYLYRLIFVLYAESEGRDLLDTDNRIYNENYSLNRLKQEVCDELEETNSKYKKWQSNLWDRLEKLFLLIDKGSKNRGIPKDDLFIPAYNGGLFRTEVDEETSKENKFLQNNKVGDFYLARVINKLTRHEGQNGEGRVFVDYSSLDIRHLGSIYEGLLEYNLNVASEEMVAIKEDKEEKWYSKEEYEGDETIIEELDEGEIYLTTDKGERKATGSYYTPEYVVQYIVENTLDPILDDIREELLREKGGDFANDFAERVFELKVLDPAMGSGHFLTNAVDHLAREIVDAHQRQAEEEGAESVDESHDIHWARRQVAQKCIYGVDLNPMAVELAKVSLWLRTLAAQQPLAFLDHHLMTGNSLIGSDIEDIEELDSSQEKNEVNTATLEDFGMTWKGTMEDLMSIYQDFIKIENQELSDIKEMEEKFHEFEHEPIKERLEAMANVHTAREFGVDVPGDAFSEMAKAIDDESKWEDIEGHDWYGEAQILAREKNKNFFHWKLAFPEVFYEDDGGKKEDAGFNVVIGNPPWGAKFSDREKSYHKKKYRSIIDRMTDSYMYFVKESLDKLSIGGGLGFITPSPFLNQSDVSKLRKHILDRSKIERVNNLGDDVFGDEVDTPSCIFVTFLSDDKGKIKTQNLTSFKPSVKKEMLGDSYTELESDFYQNQHNYSFLTDKLEATKVIERLKKDFKPLEEYIGEINRGISSDLNEAFIVTKSEKEKYDLEEEKCKPVLEGEHVRRFSVHKTDKFVIYLTRNDRIENYPNLKSYLEEYKDDITCSEVEKGKHPWYSLHRPRNEKIFESPKLIGLTTCNHLEIAREVEDNYLMDSLYVFQLESSYNAVELSLLLNSKICNFIYRYFAQEDERILPQVKSENMYPIPIPDPSKFQEKFEKSVDELFEKFNFGEKTVENITEYIGDKIKRKNSINLNLLDYLRISTKTGIKDSKKGDTLGELYMPPPDVADSPLSKTKDDLDGLRIEDVSFDSNEKQLIMNVDISYKPQEGDYRETDRYDRIVESEFETYPAMIFLDLSDEKEALIKEFAPVVVEEGEGFANFRKNAQTTISLLDRLEKLTLPKLSDVEEGLEKYLEKKEKAEQLDEEIKDTDHTIDVIVFDLYDLTEDEVEVVLESLDTPEDEKEDILNKFRNVDN